MADEHDRSMMENLYWWGIPTMFRCKNETLADQDIALVGVPHSTVMANKMVFSLNSILFLLFASPKCAGVPSKTIKSRLVPRPSKEAPPQSLPTINSYASLIALNSATSASGFLSGCAVAINLRYFALISLGSSFAVAPIFAYARSNAPSSPLLAANPSTQFSNDPQSSIPYSNSTDRKSVV